MGASARHTIRCAFLVFEEWDGRAIGRRSLYYEASARISKWFSRTITTGFRRLSSPIFLHIGHVYANRMAQWCDCEANVCDLQSDFGKNCNLSCGCCQQRLRRSPNFGAHGDVPGHPFLHLLRRAGVGLDGRARALCGRPRPENVEGS